jgi:hypothetical protein
MTEQQNEVNSGQEGINSEAPEQEKLLPQSHVNKLIAEAKSTAAQKAYAKAQADMQANAQSMPQLNSGLPSTGSGEDIRKTIADELAKHTQTLQENALRIQQQQAQEQAIAELTKKIEASKEKIPDYAEKLAEVDNFNFPGGAQLLQLTNGVDNAGDVLYELAKNPHKISSLLSSPFVIAKSQIKSLSNSIKMNDSATDGKVPDEPLRQITPSNIGVGKAPSTPNDFVNAYKGRY